MEKRLGNFKSTGDEFETAGDGHGAQERTAWQVWVASTGVDRRFPLLGEE